MPQTGSVAFAGSGAAGSEPPQQAPEALAGAAPARSLQQLSADACSCPVSTARARDPQPHPPSPPAATPCSCLVSDIAQPLETYTL
ncbi:hypothetical protein [Bradyrhizobium sp. HKCCYLRH1030]|uniref:hypothetical protein n=1 Tax=Bradyrhizobium sp. HKCCYLRH1030 TaxID=3420744 RepID=UPI003EBF37E7